MATTFTQAEEAQLAQTIEMFEVITQTQPHDYQSLEILKEAYSKLGREKDVIATSKRIAEAYVLAGQFSSAILEYETILQHHPEDPEVQAALKAIESKAAAASQPATTDTAVFRRSAESSTGFIKKPGVRSSGSVDDGRKQMYKIFVEGKIIAASDFDLCWPTPDLSAIPMDVAEPFIQVIADKGLMVADASLKLLSDRTRVAYLPLEKYEMDMELARSFPAETCRRWCVLPFDRMSKSVMVATANPFNQQAAKELAEATNNRLLWYLVPPQELVKNLRKVFR
jgi:Type II secretion system (T2SS), protein E, N-terminal domain